MRGIISELTDSVRGVSKDTGVSPVIGVVLLVVIVVAIGGVVGFFATELSNQNQETSQTGITVNESQSELVVEVVEPGNTNSLDIRVNGQTINTIDTEAGARINLAQETNLCQGDKVTVIGNNGNSSEVLTTDTLSTDTNCQIQGTTTNSTAEYDGSSWIVDTYLSNNSTKEQYYIVTVSNGEDQQVTDTVTLQPRESTTLTSTQDSYAKDDPIAVGVHSPNQSSSEYTLTGGSTSDGSGGSQSTDSITAGWSGGDEAGAYYYEPDTSTTSSTNSSLVSVNGSSEPNLSLSTSRATKGESVTAFATLTTTESPSTDETLILYATETNTSSNIISKNTYTIQQGENKDVSQSFSISNSGEYIISASLKGSSKMHKVGTIEIVSPSTVSLTNSSVTDKNSDNDYFVDEQITLSGEIKNTGSNSKEVTVEFYQNGNEINSKSISVSGGSTQTVTETFTPTESGLQTFHIGIIEPAIVEEIGEVYVLKDNSISAEVSSSPQNPEKDTDVTFDVTASHSDTGVSIDEYQWEFSDGKTATTTNSKYVRSFPKNREYYTYDITIVASNGDTQKVGGSVFTSSNTTTVLDSFEDGNHNGWTDSDGQFKVVNSPVVDGEKALFSTNKDVYNAHGFYQEETGFGPGDTLSTYVYHENGNVNSVILFGPSNPTRNSSGFPEKSYFVEYNTEDRQFRIGIRDINNTGVTYKDTVASDPIRDRWLEYEVIWGTDGEIVYNVYKVDPNKNRTSRVGKMTMTSTKYTSGSQVTLVVNDVTAAGTNVEILYDGIRITE